MKIKKGLDVNIDDFWYDLFDGGYIVPDKLCANENDVDKVNNAISILEDFKNSVFKIYGDD